MISDEDLIRIAEDDHVNCGDAAAMAKELLAYRHKLLGSVAFATISNMGCNISFAKYTKPGDLK